ncbi:MAG TPA: hypothetical protein VF942_05460 [Acidimicrobiales bacterium]
MTQQYLVGELSLILSELQAAATNAAAVRDVVRLRREAETTPPTALGPVVARAVKLGERVCWDALTQGESAGFIRDTAIYAELWEFGVCAGFLEEGQTRNDMGRS